MISTILRWSAKTLFVVLLVSVVLIVGALTFIPALALGPIVEHLQMMNASFAN